MDLFRYGVRFGTQGQTLDHQHLTPLRISVLIARNLTGFSTFDHLLLLLLLFNLLVFNSAKGTFSASCSLPTGKPDRDYSNPALRFFFLSFLTLLQILPNRLIHLVPPFVHRLAG